MTRHVTTAALAALCLTAGSALAQTPTPPAEPVGTKLVEIYRIAPGKHEAFLRAIVQFDEANRRGGVPPRQLYVHSDGASWDFMLIQDAEYPDGKGEAVGRAYREMSLPSGPRFFTEFRAFLLEHTDTFVRGPTTAAAYLAELDATPASVGLGGSPARTYALSTTVPLGGSTRWDYLRVDASGRRLYVAHDTAVDVVDLDSRRVIGRVTGLAGAHGIALAPEDDRGFVANGDRGTISSFRLSTREVVGDARVGEDPDSVTFDPVSRRLFVWNGGSRDVTILDSSSLALLATVPLGGSPEFAVADGRGAVFVNLEDTSEILRVDTAPASVAARLALPGCEGPHGLAIDATARRLFSACANAVLVVVDADTGRPLGTAPIGQGADAVVFDPVQSRVLVSSGEGFISVFDVGADGALEHPVDIQTRATGRTMAFDPKTGALFVPAVDLAVDWSTRQAAFAPDGLKLYVFEQPTR